MINNVLVWRVVDWDGRYESSQSLKKTGPLPVVPVSTDLGRVVMRRLLDRPGSAEILGVWYVLQMLAAQGSRRGVLSSFGRPLTAQDLATLSGFDLPLIERALNVLAGPEVGLLEQVGLETALEPPVIAPPPPRKPRQRRPKAFARCPVCDADLVSLAESEEFQHLLIPDCDAACDGECDDDECECHADQAGSNSESVEEFSVAAASSDCVRISDLRRRFEAGAASPEEVQRFLKDYYQRLGQPMPALRRPPSQQAGRPATIQAESVDTRLVGIGTDA